MGIKHGVGAMISSIEIAFRLLSLRKHTVGENCTDGLLFDWLGFCSFSTGKKTHIFIFGKIQYSPT